MSARMVAQRLYDAFAVGDMEEIGRLLDGTHWIEARGGPFGGVYRGLEEVGPQVFGPIGEVVRDFVVRPDEWLEIGGNRLLALGHYRGTTDQGPFEIRFGHLFTVEGERISHFEQFTDTHEWRLATAR